MDDSRNMVVSRELCRISVSVSARKGDHEKAGTTTHRDEPHQASKSLNFKPIFNIFACEYTISYSGL